jgi:hypothetical protein
MNNQVTDKPKKLKLCNSEEIFRRQLHAEFQRLFQEELRNATANIDTATHAQLRALSAGFRGGAMLYYTAVDIFIRNLKLDEGLEGLIQRLRALNAAEVFAEILSQIRRLSELKKISVKQDPNDLDIPQEHKCKHDKCGEK